MGDRGECIAMLALQEPSTQGRAFLDELEA
jgi:hypothetical protein